MRVLAATVLASLLTLLVALLLSSPSPALAADPVHLRLVEVVNPRVTVKLTASDASGTITILPEGTIHQLDPSRWRGQLSLREVGVISPSVELQATDFHSDESVFFDGSVLGSDLTLEVSQYDYEHAYAPVLIAMGSGPQELDTSSGSYEVRGTLSVPPSAPLDWLLARDCTLDCFSPDLTATVTGEPGNVTVVFDVDPSLVLTVGLTVIGDIDGLTYRVLVFVEIDSMTFGPATVSSGHPRDGPDARPADGA